MLYGENKLKSGMVDKQCFSQCVDIALTTQLMLRLLNIIRQQLADGVRHNTSLEFYNYLLETLQFSEFSFHFSGYRHIYLVLAST